jgi:hypothetical protein
MYCFSTDKIIKIKFRKNGSTDGTGWNTHNGRTNSSVPNSNNLHSTPKNKTKAMPCRLRAGSNDMFHVPYQPEDNEHAHSKRTVKHAISFDGGFPTVDTSGSDGFSPVVGTVSSVAEEDTFTHTLTLSQKVLKRKSPPPTYVTQQVFYKHSFMLSMFSENICDMCPG